ncbi:MAG: SDR family NAD(P)-dependent oxidoreductase [Acidobacteriia bacterium]|nr:SDR family NAD(P)-dependent oxidoreductase [Terriglobia bacterium]
MSTYAVTGVAGFIGSSVAEQLLSEGHSVIGIDNLNDAYDVRLKCWRLERMQHCSRMRFHRADVSDRKQVEAVFEENGPVDAVLNLAARAGVRASVENPHAYVETNVTGTLNLLDACRTRGIGKFVLASTSSVYGSCNTPPYREDDVTDRPCSPYAATKKAAEALCHSYHHLYGIDVTVLRYFSVYGPAGRPDMSPFRFVQWISEGRPVTVYGDGTQLRDFTYVTDVARGTVASAGLKGWQVLNLGGGCPVPLHELIGAVEQEVGRRAIIVRQPGHAADPRATHADYGRAQEQLSWEPLVPFREGVRNIVAWYQANRDWARTIVTD